MQEVQIDGRSAGAYQAFIRNCRAKTATHFLRERVVLFGIRLWRPEHLVVWLVEEFPDDAATGEVFGSDYGPARKCGAGFRGAHRLSPGVKRVAIIEDEQRAKVKIVELLQQTIVCREIELAALAFSDFPEEVHAHPAKTGLGDHLYFAGLWLDEVNVHAERLFDGGRIRRGRPTARAFS